jgi:hypothetical protein
LSGFEDNNYRKKPCIMVETSQATISEICYSTSVNGVKGVYFTILRIF